MDGLRQTAVLLVCFVGAGLAGCLTAAAVGESGMAALSDHLHGTMALLGEGGGETPSLPAVIWELGRWPLLALLLGTTALGVGMIPALFCVRGFLLAYSVAAFVRVFGNAGMLAALAVFGLPALAGGPALFCAGTLAFSNALRLAAETLDKRPLFLSGARLWVLVPCGVLLTVAIVLQQTLMPELLRIVAGMLE